MIAIFATACSDEGSSSPSNLSKTSEGDPIKVGVLEDQTGDFAQVGLQKIHGYQLAAEEINAAGGVLGRPIELISPDTQSDNKRYQEFARKLILDDEVAVIHGAVTSASREAIRPIMEEHEMLYFYNQQYEGGVASKTTFATGAVPEHQVQTLVKGLIEEYGSRIYTIAGDFNFGQTTADWIRKEAEESGGEIIAEEFIPLGVSQFSSTISKINQAKPDILFVVLSGTEHSSFFGQWAAEGIKGIPMATNTNVVHAYEHLTFDPPALSNMYVVAPFLEEFAELTPEAKGFVEKWRAKFPNDPYIGMEAETAYVGLYLWAAGVEKAGTLETDAVIEALESGISFDAPSGKVTIDPKTHHTIKDVQLVSLDENHEMQFHKKWEGIEPSWLSEEKGVDLVNKPEFTQYSPLD